MEGALEKDCSPLWNLYQQIVNDMKNGAPMWEEFISKTSKLHSALKSALVAVAAFLDAFQKIADAATSARGATKEIGTALTRMCLRHRAIETRMKTFISALTESLISPLTERAEEWRRGTCAGALSREHARDVKRTRAELRRRAHEASRAARKARRQPDAQRRGDVNMQDIQERKQQLEEMEERAVKAALVEERSRFCQFVSLLNPVVESEIAILAEVGHLQEGNEQLLRHINEPRTLPPASLQVICDIKSSSSSNWCLPTGTGSAPHSPTPSSRLGSRKSSICSISSLTSACSGSERLQGSASGSNVSCSTPISNASSGGTAHNSANNSLSQLPVRVRSSDSGFRSADTPLPPLPPMPPRRLQSNSSLCAGNGSDNQSVSSECGASAKTLDDGQRDDDEDSIDNIANAGASATWPDLKDTAQFERAASAIMGSRPHTISAAYEKGHPRPALSVHTFGNSERDVSSNSPRETIYARPPLPTRCSSLERPTVPTKSSNAPQPEFKTTKPTSLPPHLTKEMPQALYVNMSELATLAAGRAQQQQQQQQQSNQQPQNNHQQQQQSNQPQHGNEQPQQEKVCSESSASESSLESSSGYGSQGAFATDDHQHHHVPHQDDSEIVILRHESETAIAAARESFSISLGSLEEAVRSLDEVKETDVSFATIKPSIPKKRPLSMTAGGWSRRGSASSLGKPPPPVRRSSSITRHHRPVYGQGSSPQVTPQGASSEADNLPPPPAFLLRPDGENTGPTINVAETVKQLTELKHMPASPSLMRRNISQIQSQTQASNPNPPNQSPTQPQLSTFAKNAQNSPQYVQNSPQYVQNSTQYAQNSTQYAQNSPQYAQNTPNLNPIYGQTGHRILTYVEQNSIYGRKNSINSSTTDIYRETNSIYGDNSPNRNSPHGSSPSTPSYGDNSFSSFRSEGNYGQTGLKMSESGHFAQKITDYGQSGLNYGQRADKKFGSSTIYAQPSQIIQGFNNMAIGRGNESLSPLALRKNIAARSQSADRRGSEQSGLIASLSAKLAPQLSPRTTRRAISTITGSDTPTHTKNKAAVSGGMVAPAFLDKLSATLQQQRRQLDTNRATTVRHIINTQAQPDPRICHGSLMEQIKRGATLKRNKHCNDRSAPKIR